MYDRKKILEEILEERVRQFNLPGIEFDCNNSPNDWAAIVASYALKNTFRRTIKPDIENFKTDMIAAAAVILAALEHLEIMDKNNMFL